MNEFKREERYIVIKLKDLDEEMIDEIRGNLIGIRTRECVVAEPHHPHYEETWENVQRWTEGRPSIGDERDALAAHVERLTGLLHRFSKAMRAYEMDVDWDQAPPRDHRQMLRDAERALATAPTTSLARRDAEKQRYAYLAGWMASGEGSNGEYHGDGHESPKWLAEREEWIRRQAEGGDS